LLPGLLVLASCSFAPVEAAWVVLGEDGVAIARVVTTAAACPALIEDGVARDMSVRAGPATIDRRTTASDPADSKVSAFPVLTCEAPLAKGARSATAGGRELPLPKAQPSTIVVIGDSGCRMKRSDNAFQRCADASAWPFKEISDAAAALKPDLVIHLGDYHYRENRCPEGDAGCTGSAWGYGWDTWNADLFTPAAALLGAAPWVVVRGNHESCRRAGQGWWRFLDPRPMEPGRDCNADADDSTGDYSAPYRVPIGGGAQLIVFDSSNVPSKVTATGNPALRIYTEHFKAANRLADQARFTLFVMHHPILGFAPVRGSQRGIETQPGDAPLQAVMRSLNGKRLFPGSVAISLAGHVHLFEAIGFSSDHPAQLVVGNGGSSLHRALPRTLSPTTTPFADAVVDSFSSAPTFGFVTIERIDKGWWMTSRDRDGASMKRCAIEGGKLSCNP
jgi:hypothetical protein